MLKVFLAIGFFSLLGACGSECSAPICKTVVNEKVVYKDGKPGTGKPGTGKPGGTGDTGQAISYPKMQSLLNQYCVNCHATADFMQNESALKRSDVRSEVWNKTMPPQGQSPLPETVRLQIINFF